MKKQTILSIAYITFMSILLSSCSDESTSAETDSFDASVVCPAEGVNAYGEPNRGTFTDARDGQLYKYTTIGNQVWMAENLKFDAPYSLCYERTEGFCDTFGRFYSLHVNGNDLDYFDQELLDTICPAGWHVPSMDEWNALVVSMGGSNNAGRRLMSSSDFGERYTPGTDDCGFNSLPAGSWLKNGSLASEYSCSRYWTSTAKNLSSSYLFGLNAIDYAFSINEPKMSLRCIKD